MTTPGTAIVHSRVDLSSQCDSWRLTECRTDLRNGILLTCRKSQDERTKTAVEVSKSFQVALPSYKQSDFGFAALGVQSRLRDDIAIIYLTDPTVSCGRAGSISLAAMTAEAIYC